MKNIVKVAAGVFFIMAITSCTDTNSDLEEQIAIENELQARRGRIHPSQDPGVYDGEEDEY